MILGQMVKIYVALAWAKGQNRLAVCDNRLSPVLEPDHESGGETRNRSAVLSDTENGSCRYRIRLKPSFRTALFCKQTMKTTTKPNGAETSILSLDRQCLRRLRLADKKATHKCEQLYWQGKDIATELSRAGVDPDSVPRRIEIMMAEQRADRATVKCEVEIPAWVYGYLCAAAAVHGLPDYKAMLLEYLRCTVTEWGNQGYYLEE